MNVEDKQRWIEHNAGQAIDEFGMECLPLLPQDVQAAVRGLVTYAFLRGYNWGTDHGRSYLATSRRPSYSVPKPALEAVAEPPIPIKIPA